MRAAAAPPVANQISRLSRATRQELLAAKAPSLGSVGGVLRRFQLRPPSSVVRITNSPPTGSPSTTARLASQNARPSKKPPASGFVNSSDQCAPASTVL